MLQMGKKYIHLVFTINAFQVFFWQVVIMILHITSWVITPLNVNNGTTLLMVMCLHCGGHVTNNAPITL